MNIFISGGCKNGKSLHAQELAKEMADEQHVPLYYIATMIPADDEDRLRIKKHLEARDGWGFITVEKPVHLMGMFENDFRDENGDPVDPHGAFLLDSVTALLSNEMFLPDWEFNAEAHLKVEQELTKLCKWVKNIVLVSDFIYSDAGLYDDYTECYRSGLAWCDRKLVEISDLVVELCSGNLIVHKGELPQ